MSEDGDEQQIPEPMRRYVRSLAMTGEGANGAAHLMLTVEGIDLGSQRVGSHSLARLVMAYPRWHGTRTQANVASEIRAHSLAWRLIPPLRSAADPVDLEFTQPWPRNLLTSIRMRGLDLLKRLGLFVGSSH